MVMLSARSCSKVVGFTYAKLGVSVKFAVHLASAVLCNTQTASWPTQRIATSAGVDVRVSLNTDALSKPCKEDPDADVHPNDHGG